MNVAFSLKFVAFVALVIPALLHVIGWIGVRARPNRDDLLNMVAVFCAGVILCIALFWEV